MGITKTVRSSGGDYTTIQGALDFFNNYDFSSNGGGVCYIDIYPEGGGTNGEWVLGSMLTGPTGTTNVSAANYLHIRAASGYSFKDHANKATNALRYNPANGVAIRYPTNGVVGVMTIRPNYTRLSGLQLAMDYHNYNYPLLSFDTNINYGRIENCIMKTAGSLVLNGLSGINVEVINSVWYGGCVHALPYTNGGTKIINCTGYKATTQENYGALRFDYNQGLVQNCLLYSGDTRDAIYLALGASLYTGSGYNGTDDTSGGSNSQNNLTFSDVYESVTGGSEDFRLKASAAQAIKTGGTDTTSYTSDLDIVGRARNGTTPSIGAWEYIQSSQLAAPTSDISAGNWLRSSDGTGTGLYTMLDEATYSDTDYCYVSSDSTMEVKFASVSDPAVSTGHKVRYRIKGNGVATITVSLRQGSGTEIASWAHTTASTTTTSYEQTLTGGQADSITDYADLRLRFVTFTP